MLDSIPDRVADDPRSEEAAFRAPVENIVDEFRSLETDAQSPFPPEDRALFAALALIASSGLLVESTIDRIHGGNWAPGGLRETIEEYAGQFATTEDLYLRERVRDIQDIELRILAYLEFRVFLF